MIVINKAPQLASAEQRIRELERRAFGDGQTITQLQHALDAQQVTDPLIISAV